MTDYDNGLSHIAVTQLAGPGVPGLEGDTPLYHFDVEGEDLRDLAADPDDFVTRLGLRPDKDRQYPKMNFRLVGLAADAPNGGLPKTLPPDGGPPDGGPPPSHSCCYVSGDDEMTCHMHDPGH
jgi:hypothetical protein